MIALAITTETKVLLLSVLYLSLFYYLLCFMLQVSVKKSRKCKNPLWYTRSEDEDKKVTPNLVKVC